MPAYRISADALLRLAILADTAPGANAGTILTLLREAEPIGAAVADEPTAAPIAEVEPEDDASAAKIAKPE